MIKLAYILIACFYFISCTDKSNFLSDKIGIDNQGLKKIRYSHIWDFDYDDYEVIYFEFYSDEFNIQNSRYKIDKTTYECSNFYSSDIFGIEPENWWNFNITERETYFDLYSKGGYYFFTAFQRNNENGCYTGLYLKKYGLFGFCTDRKLENCNLCPNLSDYPPIPPNSKSY